MYSLYQLQGPLYICGCLSLSKRFHFLERLIHSHKRNICSWRMGIVNMVCFIYLCIFGMRVAANAFATRKVQYVESSKTRNEIVHRRQIIQVSDALPDALPVACGHCGARGAYDGEWHYYGVRQCGGDGGELLQENRSLSPYTDNSLDYTHQPDTLEVLFACPEVAHLEHHVITTIHDFTEQCSYNLG